MNQEKIAEIVEHKEFLTHELNQIIDRFHREPQRLDARGLLVDDLHSYVRRFWPEASLSEARCVVQNAAQYSGRIKDGRKISIVVRSYENMLEDAAAKEAEGDEGGDNHDDAQSELNQQNKKRKGLWGRLFSGDQR